MAISEEKKEFYARLMNDDNPENEEIVNSLYRDMINEMHAHDALGEIFEAIAKAD